MRHILPPAPSEDVSPGPLGLCEGRPQEEPQADGHVQKAGYTTAALEPSDSVALQPLM